MGGSQAAPPAGARRGGLRTLAGYAAPRRAALAVAMVLAIGANGAALVQPLIISRVISAVLGHRGVSSLVIVLVCVFVGGAISSTSSTFVMSRAGEALVRDLRVRLGVKLLRLPVREHDARRSGDLLSRASGDIMLLRTVLTTGPINAVTGILTLLASIGLMAYVDWVLLLITLGVVSVMFAMLAMLVPRVKGATLAAQQGLGRLIGVLDRDLRAIRTVKASRAEGREADSIGAAAESAYRAGVRVAGVQAMISPATSLGVQGSFLLVLGVGGERVATGQMTIASLIAFLLYLTTLAVPLVNLGQFMSDLQKALGALDRVQEIMTLPVEDEDAGHGLTPVLGSAGAAGIRFAGVRFGYGDRIVLHDVSFDIPAGSHTAIVGPSGAGKSTLLSLIERFYDPEAGTVLLDEEDVAAIPLPELRQIVAFVEQETPVLAGTVGENIRYSHPEASDEDMRETVEQVRLTGLVNRLPNGLDTDVGDAGVLMSGGERQRIAIARALIGRPRVLLLDEATSQLDAVNETAMRETIRQTAGPECTVVTVAHRLSTVTGADQIIVLSQGQVVATGRHHELMAASDVYRELVEGQLITTGAQPDVPEPVPVTAEPEVVAASEDAIWEGRRLGWWR